LPLLGLQCSHEFERPSSCCFRHAPPLYILCVSPHALVAVFFCFVFLQAHTTTQPQYAHCSGFECFFCGACWQLRVAAVVFFRGHEEKGGGGVRSPSLFSCGCDAPRVTALSWAPFLVEGGMAGKFSAASLMDEGSLPHVAGVVGARSVCVVWWPRRFCCFPLGVEMSCGRWWWMSPPAWWAAAGVVCLPCVDAVSWCVNCAAGTAATPHVVCSLSLYPLCSVPLSLVAFFFFCLTDQLTDSSDSTTRDDDCDGDDGDGAAPCWSLRSCAAAARPCV
ncbi:hypothetical protein TcCL_NonESM09966, partial [Trypanosoma cruzi]